VASARDVFASVGFDAPLSLIARRAGVGQGSLYRHFPDRASLALAVFEENIAGLETRAAEPDATLDDLLAEVIDQLTTSVGFIEMVDPASRDPRLLSMHRRLQRLLARKLDDSAGAVRGDIGAEDLMLALAMLAGVLSRTDVKSRPKVASRAWTLLRQGLRA
jgi:AcrR family transcriptional regulator